MFLKDHLGNTTLEGGGTVHAFTLPRTCGDGIQTLSSKWEESSDDMTVDIGGLGVGTTVSLDVDVDMGFDLEINL